MRRRLPPLRSLPVVTAVALATPTARAATYVEPTPESRPVIGLSFSTGTLGDADGGLPAAGGAGVELESGWAWEHGLSLVVTFGETRHARGDALTARLGLLDARASDDAVGLRARLVLGRAELAPYAQGSLAADRVRFSGAREGSALGASVALGGGLRLRLSPWELTLGVDARRTWLEAPSAELPSIAVTRAVVALGARLDW